MCNPMTCTTKFEEGNFCDRLWYGGVNIGGESSIVLKVEVREIGQENSTIQRWIHGVILGSHPDGISTEIGE
jgi:hypothetical protein